jgi:hypothetical protein
MRSQKLGNGTTGTRNFYYLNRRLAMWLRVTAKLQRRPRARFPGPTRIATGANPVHSCQQSKRIPGSHGNLLVRRRGDQVGDFRVFTCRLSLDAGQAMGTSAIALAGV